MWPKRVPALGARSPHPEIRMDAVPLPPLNGRKADETDVRLGALELVLCDPSVFLLKIGQQGGAHFAVACLPKFPAQVRQPGLCNFSSIFYGPKFFNYSYLERSDLINQ